MVYAVSITSQPWNQSVTIYRPRRGYGYSARTHSFFVPSRRVQQARTIDGRKHLLYRDDRILSRHFFQCEGTCVTCVIQSKFSTSSCDHQNRLELLDRPSTAVVYREKCLALRSITDRRLGIIHIPLCRLRCAGGGLDASGVLDGNKRWHYDFDGVTVMYRSGQSSLGR